MQLTLFSDYALRLLLYLGAHSPVASSPEAETLPSLQQISAAYGISFYHLNKVARRLVALQYVEARRGRSGGLRLRVAPSEIRLGAVVRATEPNFHLVECFDSAHNTCPIAPACGLRRPLAAAQRAFLDVLDRYTLADALGNASVLTQLWQVRLTKPRGKKT
jgi:Rrf2 family nitric oxide-sensitive transcriptional repressor